MITKSIGIKNLRKSISAIADEMEKGKNISFQVLRRSRPSFKIVPIDTETDIWETVVDFTEENNGISIDQALSELN